MPWSSFGSIVLTLNLWVGCFLLFIVRWFLSFRAYTILQGILGWYHHHIFEWNFYDKLYRIWHKEFPDQYNMSLILLFRYSYDGIFNRFEGTFNLNSFMLFLTAWKTLKLHITCCLWKISNVEEKHSKALQKNQMYSITSHQ